MNLISAYWQPYLFRKADELSSFLSISELLNVYFIWKCSGAEWLICYDDMTAFNFFEYFYTDFNIFCCELRLEFLCYFFDIFRNSWREVKWCNAWGSKTQVKPSFVCHIDWICCFSSDFNTVSIEIIADSLKSVISISLCIKHAGNFALKLFTYKNAFENSLSFVCCFYIR